MANPPLMLTPSSYPGIVIATQGDGGNFANVVNTALLIIGSGPMGRMLLSSIERDGPVPPQAARGAKVTIRDAASDARRSNVSIRFNETHACWQAPQGAQGAQTEGQGTFTAIYWDPNITQTPDGVRPYWIGLAHELIHARRNLLGIGHLNDNRTEELHTVGLSLHGSPGGISQHDRGRWGPISENDIRAEHGIGLRTRYSFPDGAIVEEFAYLSGFF
jgi:Effector protein